MNEAIIAEAIRLVGEDGDLIGVMTVDRALQHCEEAGLDLVEISPHADPPVCRIMDYGKFKYQQKKRANEARKKQVQIVVKEVKFRPKTDVHDIDYKVRNILRFLAEGNKAKVSVVFRGREMAHIDRGAAVIDEVLSRIGEEAVVEASPRMEGRIMSMVLAPAKKGDK